MSAREDLPKHSTRCLGTLYTFFPSTMYSGTLIRMDNVQMDTDFVVGMNNDVVVAMNSHYYDFVLVRIDHDDLTRATNSY